jgi:adenylate kinase family enzyme
VNDLIVQALSQPPPGNGYILVGYPKTKNQAALLEKDVSGYYFAFLISLLK